MKELDEYFALQQTIYDHFGYKDVWSVFPFSHSINDARPMWWSIRDNSVYWSLKKENHQKLIDQCYEADDNLNDVDSADVLSMVYETNDKKFSMFQVMHGDDNVFLVVFDNAKRFRS
jgi:hypothetical protein